jgi:hypothetical protein
MLVKYNRRATSQLSLNVEKNVMGDIIENSWAIYFIARYRWHYLSWALLKILTQSLGSWSGISTYAFRDTFNFQYWRLRPALGPIQRPIQWVPGTLSPGVECRADLPPSSSVEVKIDETMSLLSRILHGMHSDTFIFTGNFYQMLSVSSSFQLY